MRGIPASFSAAVVLAALALAGCGGDGGDDTATTPGGGQGTTAQKQKSQQGGANGGGKNSQGNRAASGDESKQGGSSGGGGTTTAPPSSGSAQAGSKAAAPGVPLSRGGDNSIQTFGTEASNSEAAQAATTLQAYLNARASARWATACSYLATRTKSELRQLAARSNLDSGGCVDVLKIFTAGVAGSVLRGSAKIDEVLSFRTNGGRAFLIYRGPPESTVYDAPMAREGGGWKVATVAPGVLPVFDG